MEVVAYQKFIRVSPRKLRLVADAVRDMHPTESLVHLQFIHKGGAKILHKLMKQAVANAVNNSKLQEKDLEVKHILVEEGPRYKRYVAASRGRARTILKRTSHVKVVLGAKETKVEKGTEKKNQEVTKK